MSLKIAIVGFRHGHINDLVGRLESHPNAELVAVCEEDAAARATLEASGKYDHVYDSYEKMLDEVECDAVATGDYYSIRGQRLIEALRRGKHVIGDKPLCTSLDELDEIEKLAREKNLSVGCQLDMRSNGVLRRLRRFIADGELGEICAASFGGQHPLLWGSRPAWYFEEGKHGGTINDIGIHAFDLIPWLTGLQWDTVRAARTWNCLAKEAPHFNDAAQMMMTLENGAGVLGDVSYFAPNSQGYSTPFYWRVTLWGEKGVAEFCVKKSRLKLYMDGDSEGREIEGDAAAPGEYFESFVRDASGKKDVSLTTKEVLSAAWVSLQTQLAADDKLNNVSL